MLMLASAVAVACDEGDVGSHEAVSGECLHHHSEENAPHHQDHESQHSCLVHLCTCVHMAIPVQSAIDGPSDPLLVPHYAIVVNCDDLELSFCIDHPPKA